MAEQKNNKKTVSEIKLSQAFFPQSSGSSGGGGGDCVSFSCCNGDIG